MKKIKMLHTYMSPSYALHLNKEYLVENELAENLVRHKTAVFLEPEPKIERADKQHVENAMDGRYSGRGRKRKSKEPAEESV